MPITRDQVLQITNDLTGRANAAIADLQNQKSALGALTGNNDTVQQSIGALQNTITQIGPWSDQGDTLADAETDNPAIDDSVDLLNWQSAGQAFVTSIAEIDKNGNDASLDAVLTQTVDQTGKDLAALPGKLPQLIAPLSKDLWNIIWAAVQPFLIPLAVVFAGVVVLLVLTEKVEEGGK